MNNKQVAHLWANQSKPSASGSNFFFEGDTIYSYGHHFPIARIIGDHVLFTTRDYSSSTSRHKSHALRAIAHNGVFHVDDVTSDRHADRVGEYMERIKQAFDVAKRARESKIWRHQAAVEICNEFVKYCEVFGLPNPFEGTEAGDMVFKAREHLELLKEQREQEERERNARLKKEAEECVADFLSHKIGAVNKLFYIPPILRCTGENNSIVQTSHGAEVGYDSAKRSFQFIKALWDKGENWKRNGHTHHVGNFSLECVLSETVIIGCHTFERSEIERFAAQEGW